MGVGVGDGTNVASGVGVSVGGGSVVFPAQEDNVSRSRKIVNRRLWFMNVVTDD